MTITAKQLADGQLPNAEGDLYTAPAATTAYVKSITLHNTNAAAQTCTILLKPSGGVARIVAQLDLNAGYTFYSEIPYVLDTGDKLRGDDGGAGGNLVDYTINGAEET